MDGGGVRSFRRRRREPSRLSSSFISTPSRGEPVEKLRSRRRRQEVLEQDRQEMVAMVEVLQHTSLAEMGDTELGAWLTSTASWASSRLREVKRDRTSPSQSMATLDDERGEAVEIHWQIRLLQVLRTMPWWRLLDFAAPLVPATTVSRPYAYLFSEDNSSSFISRSQQQNVDMWQQSVLSSFEAMGHTLVEHSTSLQTVKGVVEVLMRPLTVPSPLTDRIARKLPVDELTRVMAAVSRRGSSTKLVQDLIGQCVSDWMPKMKWEDGRQHAASMMMLLHLALDTTVPAASSSSGMEGNVSKLQKSSVVMNKGIELLAAVFRPSPAGAPPSFSCLSVGKEGESPNSIGVAERVCLLRSLLERMVIMEGAVDKVENTLCFVRRDCGSAERETGLRYPSFSEFIAAGTTKEANVSSEDVVNEAVVDFLRAPSQILQMPAYQQDCAQQQRWSEVLVNGSSTIPVLVQQLYTASSQRMLPIIESSTAILYARLRHAVELRCQLAAGGRSKEDPFPDWWGGMVDFGTTVLRKGQNTLCLVYLLPSLMQYYQTYTTPRLEDEERSAGGGGEGDESGGTETVILARGASLIHQRGNEEAFNFFHRLLSLVLNGVDRTKAASGAYGGHMRRSPSSSPAIRMAHPSPSPRGSGGGVGLPFFGGGSGGSVVRGCAIPLTERLRVAMHLFPLFKFLRLHHQHGERGGGTGTTALRRSPAEIVLRRITKWCRAETARSATHEGVMMKASVTPRSSGRAGGSSGLSLLTQIVCAQACAIAALMEGVEAAPCSRCYHLHSCSVEPVTPPPSPPTVVLSEGGTVRRRSALTDLLDDVHLRTFFDRYRIEPSVSSLGVNFVKLESEGLLRLQMLSACPWPVSDRCCSTF